MKSFKNILGIFAILGTVVMNASVYAAGSGCAEVAPNDSNPFSETVAKAPSPSDEETTATSAE